MGGKVLNYEAKQIKMSGVEEGRVEANRDMITIARYINKHPYATDEEIAAACKCSMEVIPEIKKTLELLRNLQ